MGLGSKMQGSGVGFVVGIIRGTMVMRMGKRSAFVKRLGGRRKLKRGR